MAVGTCTISGAYNCADTAGMSAFITAKIVAATLSGARVFYIPAGVGTCYIGVYETST